MIVPRIDPEKQEEFLRSLNPRRSELKRQLDARRLPCAVAIDNPDKQMNIGNLIRTAHSFLCGEIILIGSRRYQAAGSHGVERFERMRHLPSRKAFLEWLPGSGYTPIAVEIHPEAERLDRFTFPERPLFVLGNELHGLHEEILASCSRRLFVPQFGLVRSHADARKDLAGQLLQPRLHVGPPLGPIRRRPRVPSPSPPAR